MKIFIRTFLIALSFCWLGFIFSNSLKTSDSSTEQSDTVVDAAESIIDTIAPENEFEHYDIAVVIRKAAHFTEFFILSLLTAVSFGLFSDNRKLSAASLILCAPVCVADELLQLTQNGRSCSIFDMLLDYSGVLAGFLAAFTLLSLMRKKKRTKL